MIRIDTKIPNLSADPYAAGIKLMYNGIEYISLGESCSDPKGCDNSCLHVMTAVGSKKIYINKNKSVIIS